MKKLILYGAGKRGKKIAELLKANNIFIEGFLDSNKKEGTWGGHKILTLDSIEREKSNYQVIITVADFNEASKIKEQLGDMEIVTVEEILADNTYGIVENSRQYIANYHDTMMEDYYQEAECENSINVFWDKSSCFYDMFSTLNLDNVIELACGHGRHVAKYKQNAGKITLVDILDKNIKYCKERFSKETNISYYVNNGHDLSKLASCEYSALFTYDAMVHFEMIDIFEYLKETQRVLKSGGRALFHHSNNTEDYRITFSTGTRGRNYMSEQLFAYLVNRAGLTVVRQKVINWANIENLDCLTLVEKE